MEPLEFAAHSHLIAQAELKADRLSKSDLFELRKVKAHLMAWLVQLKARVDFYCTCIFDRILNPLKVVMSFNL